MVDSLLQKEREKKNLIQLSNLVAAKYTNTEHPKYSMTDKPQHGACNPFKNEIIKSCPNVPSRPEQTHPPMRLGFDVGCTAKQR